MNRELAKVDVSGDVLYIRADDDSATTTDVDLAKRDESGRLVYVADRTTDVGRANALYFVEGFGERTTDAYFALRTLTRRDASLVCLFCVSRCVMVRRR